MLYQALEITPDLSLDNLYKETSKRSESERAVATTSLTVNGRYCYSEDDVEHLGEVDTCLQIMNRKEKNPQVHLSSIRSRIAIQLSIKLNIAQHQYPLK